MLVRIIQSQGHVTETQRWETVRISRGVGRWSDSAEHQVGFAERSGSAAGSSGEPRAVVSLLCLQKGHRSQPLVKQCQAEEIL